MQADSLQRLVHRSPGTIHSDSDQVQGVANKYGKNKSRFWAKSINCTGYLPLNMSNHMFKNNLNLRQACHQGDLLRIITRPERRGRTSFALGQRIEMKDPPGAW